MARGYAACVPHARALRRARGRTLAGAREGRDFGGGRSRGGARDQFDAELKWAVLEGGIVRVQEYVTLSHAG